MVGRLTQAVVATTVVVAYILLQLPSRIVRPQRPLLPPSISVRHLMLLRCDDAAIVVGTEQRPTQQGHRCHLVSSVTLTALLRAMPPGYTRRHAILNRRGTSATLATQTR